MGSLEDHPRAATEESFVGRDREIADLGAALAGAAAGRGSVFLLVGEPGIGKTRLAHEVAQRAGSSGAFVAWGRCWDGGGAPAFWPWVQILRACAQNADLSSVEPSLVAAVADLAQTDSTLELGAPDGARLPADSAQARFRLFDSITLFLARLAARTPLVLIFDDLHAADEASVHLLRFVAHEITAARIFILGTYRDGEVRRSPALARSLGELARTSQRILLMGLSAADVALLLERAAKLIPPPALVSAVHRITDGNPFFVTEVVRLLVRDDRVRCSSGDQPTLRIPDEVRAAIRRRLDPLGDDARRLLAVAAVSGREFDARVVEQVIGLMPPMPSLPLLSDAVAAGVIAEAPGSPGRYSFAHELVVDTLYHDLPLAERVALHRRTGEVMEHQYAGNTDAHIAQIAHHFMQAAHAGDAAKAIDYAARAGHAADRLLAYEQAASWYERAVALMDATAAPDDVRCRHLIALGNAYRRAGDFTTFETVFQRAVGLARALGDAELLARAAVGYGRAAAETGVINQSLVGWLEEALAGLPDEDSPLRVAVLGRLSVALYFAGTDERRVRVSQQAVEMARRLGDRQTLTVALMTRNFALWVPGHAAERLEVATELARMGDADRDLDAMLDGRSWRIIDLLELGDLQTATTDIETLARLADELRQPRDQWLAGVQRAMLALLAGRFDEGMDIARLALRVGQRSETGNAAPFFLVQQFVASRERGQLETLEVAVRGCADQFPALPIWRCGLALLYSETDRSSEARAQFERLAVDDFGTLPRDGNWLAALSLLSEVCAHLGDRARARTLYDLLQPYANLNVIIAMGAACYGSAACYLGLLATTLHRWTEAVRHFEDALAANGRLQSPPLLAHTQYAYAALLLAIPPDAGVPSTDADRAAQATTLLRASLATARLLSLAPLERKIDALVAAEHRVDIRGDSHRSAARTAAMVAFHHEGEYWSIVWGSTVLRLKDSRGLRYIAWLIRHPGREFHAAHLQGVGGAAPEIRLGDVGPILDPRARAAYTRRVRDLETELDDARQCNDVGQAERIQKEIDFLSSELAAATGMGGRERKAGSYAERARINVTRAIGSALKRMRTADDSLARYLTERLKTGNFCVYHPED